MSRQSRRSSSSITRWFGALILVALLGASGPVLRWLGAFLVTEDPLELASAIVVLAGAFPVREQEAAELYRAGFAPVVLLIPESQNEEALRVRIGLPTDSSLRLEYLIGQGVRPEAIRVADAASTTTMDELQAAAQYLRPGADPVILVTSKFHSRRVQLTWKAVVGEQPRGIVRTARRDRFNPDAWWSELIWVRTVAREYLALLDYLSGFPLATWLAQRAAAP